MNELARKLRLRVAGIALTEQRLPVQVRKLDDVIVDDGQLPDTSTRKCRNDRAADAACPDHGYPRCLELALSDSADLRQDDVPRVTIELAVRKTHRPVEPKPPAPRLVSLSVSTSRKLALSTGAGTSWAMRSPRRTSNGSE